MYVKDTANRLAPTGLIGLHDYSYSMPKDLADYVAQDLAKVTSILSKRPPKAPKTPQVPSGVITPLKTAFTDRLKDEYINYVQRQNMILSSGEPELRKGLYV